MTEVNNVFAAYVTSAAFHLSLSRSMIIGLVAVANKTHATGRQVYRAHGVRDTAVGTGRCLEDRGLVYAPDPNWPGRYELTEPGKLVMELLKMSGLVHES